MSKFKEHLVGTATFGSGLKFSVVKIKPKGACRIYNHRTGDNTYSSSIQNAWKSVRFMAKVRQDTENTHGWPKNDGVYSY